MFDIKAGRIPILDPLRLIAKSRRVMLAVVGLALNIALGFIPGLEDVYAELFVSIVVLTSLLIGGLTAEDVAIAREQAKTQPTLISGVTELASAIGEANDAQADTPDAA